MPPAPPERILIISAAIGSGHTAAANALDETLESRAVSVQHLDMLEHTSNPFRRIYRQTYFDLVRTAPSLVEWLGRRLDRLPSETKSRQQLLRARLTRLISYRLPRRIEQFGPDVLVHTHFLPPEILSTLGSRLSVPQALVITDFAAHGLWLQPGIKRYFVANPEIEAHLISSGVDAARIRVTGIPIDSRYAELPAKEVARERMGISRGRDHLLIMAGGLEKTTMLNLLKLLQGFRWPLSVTVACGRSERLVTHVKVALEDYDGPLHFEVLGYTKDIPLLMAAADLLVGKPGGLTSSEALAAGLPFAVVQPYPIHEEANASYLLESGAAMRIEPLTVLSHKLRLFFEDEPRRERMRQAALSLGRPRAAADIADSLLHDPL